MIHKIAKQIIAEARQSRTNYAVTQQPYDKIKANMYTIFECYARGIIDWDLSKAKLQNVIKEYVNLYPLEERKAEVKIMREEYKRMTTDYKLALDEYRVVAEQKMTSSLVAKQKLDESTAQHHSNVFYNGRNLTETDLKDIATLKTWQRVMEAYPNLTTKDEELVRTLENTYDTKDFEFNPRAGHRDQMSHPENQGLGGTSMSSPRPKLRPKRLAPMSSPRPQARPANLQMRNDINKAVQQAVASEGHSPHKKGTAKYKAHMAAMHAEGYKVMPPMDPKYVARSGLEGPFTTLSGKVVYYDPKEGKYYDPDTDIYMTYDEFQNYDKDYSGMKDERDDVKEEMSDEQIDAFHTALDTLVHKHLGHSSDERDEVEETLSPEEKKQVNQMYNKDGTMTDIGKKVMSQGQIQDILKKAMKQLKGIDAEAKFTHRDLNQAVATINQGDIAGALQELVNGVDGPEPQIQDTFNDAHDDLQRLINPKTDKELDDEYWQDVSDMKAKSRAGVESIVQDVLNNALEEMTSAGAFASVAAPMSKMKRRKDSIFADKENNQTAISEAQFDEAAGEKDACYHKVKSRYKVWPSAYASGALVKCRKVGAKNWGKSKK